MKPRISLAVGSVFKTLKIGELAFGGSTDDDISEFSLNNIGVENELDQLLSRFYRLDEMPKTRQPTYEESFWEETFEKAHFIEMRLAGISCTYRSWTKLMVWVLQGQRR